MDETLMYTALYMAAVRTQIYLTPEQRARIDALRRRDNRTLAEVIRDALDAYLDRETPDAGEALAGTFGSLPELAVPSRDEWDRG
jgi:hypothetical protein